MLVKSTIRMPASGCETEGRFTEVSNSDLLNRAIRLPVYAANSAPMLPKSIDSGSEPQASVAGEIGVSLFRECLGRLAVILHVHRLMLERHRYIQDHVHVVLKYP